MKKQRYKFDYEWRVAMVAADVDNPGRIERMIRAYIEDGIEPESTFAIERTFRGAWTVIKAQIKARKERNRRAAERRRQRRQEALAAKAGVESAQAAPQSAPQTAEATSQLDQAAPQPTKSAKSAKSAPQSAQFAQKSIGLSHQVQQSSVKAVPAQPVSANTSCTSLPGKLKFSDRFRGPGLKASAPS